MVQRTSIEWTDRSVNPLRARRKDNGKVGWHCVKWSSGCAHCYSEAINKRFGTGLPYSKHAADQVELFLDDRALSAILKLKTPQRIFAFDMTDWFQSGVSTEDIATMFAVFAVAHWHTFQTLTKRADRMAEIVGDPGFPSLVSRMIDERVRPMIDGKIKGDWGLVSPMAHGLKNGRNWPLPNWWAGVSVEDQKMADERIPHLIASPAVVRFLSVEPLLGRVNIYKYLFDPYPHQENWPHERRDWLHWVIVGGESGAGARPMHPDWARLVRDQCVAAGVPFFFKQHGEWVTVSRPTDADEVVWACNTYPHGRWLEPDGRYVHRTWDCVMMEKVGKKTAGRLLDGRTWDEFPDVPPREQANSPHGESPVELRPNDLPGQRVMF